MQNVAVAVVFSNKHICWLHSLRRLGRETCKEIEPTRRLLKEHSTQSLTASHSEHEAIETWSGKLLSLYFTQQENPGCPGWQNIIISPKSSQGLSHFVLAYSADTQNIQHGPDWIFHCYGKEGRGNPATPMVQLWACSLRTCATFTSPRQWQIGICLGWQWHACRQVYLHEWTCVNAPCGRRRQRPASGGPCAVAWHPGEKHHGAVLQMSF